MLRCTNPSDWGNLKKKCFQQVMIVHQGISDMLTVQLRKHGVQFKKKKKKLALTYWMNVSKTESCSNLHRCNVTDLNLRLNQSGERKQGAFQELELQLMSLNLYGQC